MFSTLIIQGCALSASQVPITVSLKSTPSFPACAYDYVERPEPVPDSWAARAVSPAKGTLEVSLLERISRGRIGIAYSARVISATTDDGSNVTNTLPEAICLKFAKLPYSRSLAREAWFYEQLADCQDISVAHCYGFFSSTFSEQNDTPYSLQPWCALEDPSSSDSEEEEETKPPGSPAISLDWLPDDEPCDEYKDTRNFKRDSPWNTWNFTPDNPTISVLVLELLGERCSDQWESFWPRDDPPDGLKEDTTAIMHDISIYGVVHNDVTAFNLLQFTGSEVETRQAHCPRHNVVHGWRIIDFDRSFRVDMENGTAQAKEDPPRFNPSAIGRRSSFWGKYS
ncbi:hypothetical protein M413DRAFT_404837 [Hebeloma cylindrosporum]|uniref:Protein kinase domain-containing protein n=1 Tax=Hebeloma cylindrosporum TaxID=76867 RepID=A0A0C2Z5T6_HEBCY|nr:hypothetical protein M413DRAFT_404837 [Hebeloma cylindrosporum h7]